MNSPSGSPVPAYYFSHSRLIAIIATTATVFTMENKGPVELYFDDFNNFLAAKDCCIIDKSKEIYSEIHFLSDDFMKFSRGNIVCAKQPKS